MGISFCNREIKDSIGKLIGSTWIVTIMGLDSYLYTMKLLI